LKPFFRLAASGIPDFKKTILSGAEYTAPGVKDDGGNVSPVSSRQGGLGERGGEGKESVNQKRRNNASGFKPPHFNSSGRMVFFTER
jgi:hypothetical protein